MLFFSYSNSKSFACSLNKLQLLPNTSSLCHWKEVDDHPGLILASDQNSGNISVIFMSPDNLYLQEITVGPPRCKSVDVVALRSTVITSGSQKIKSTSVIILADDGSIKLFVANSDMTDFWLSPTFNACSQSSVHYSVTGSERKKQNQPV